MSVISLAFGIQLQPATADGSQKIGQRQGAPSIRSSWVEIDHQHGEDAAAKDASVRLLQETKAIESALAASTGQLDDAGLYGDHVEMQRQTPTFMKEPEPHRPDAEVRKAQQLVGGLHHLEGHVSTAKPEAAVGSIAAAAELFQYSTSGAPARKSGKQKDVLSADAMQQPSTKRADAFEGLSADSSEVEFEEEEQGATQKDAHHRAQISAPSALAAMRLSAPNSKLPRFLPPLQTKKGLMPPSGLKTIFKGPAALGVAALGAPSAKK